MALLEPYDLDIELAKLEDINKIFSVIYNDSSITSFDTMKNEVIMETSARDLGNGGNTTNSFVYNSNPLSLSTNIFTASNVQLSSGVYNQQNPLLNNNNFGYHLMVEATALFIKDSGTRESVFIQIESNKSGSWNVIRRIRVESNASDRGYNPTIDAYIQLFPDDNYDIRVSFFETTTDQYRVGLEPRISVHVMGLFIPTTLISTINDVVPIPNT